MRGGGGGGEVKRKRQTYPYYVGEILGGQKGLRTPKEHRDDSHLLHDVLLVLARAKRSSERKTKRTSKYSGRGFGSAAVLPAKGLR